jgi:cellulose biosynthesis protein BcsQ
MIVLLGSKKGGCGKSTTAVNLCAELAQTGADVVLVDVLWAMVGRRNKSIMVF